MKRREWARLKSSRGMEDPGMGRPNPNNWVPERGLSPLYTALPFRDLGHPSRDSRVTLLGSYPRAELPGQCPQ